MTQIVVAGHGRDVDLTGWSSGLDQVPWFGSCGSPSISLTAPPNK